MIGPIDIFLSYATSDRKFVRLVYDTLVAQGFRVFWSESIPPGSPDWNGVISSALASAAVVVVFWSGQSVLSGPVRQEFEQAADDGKLIQVVLEKLRPIQFPMHRAYSDQRLDLSEWVGSPDHSEWRKLVAEIELRLIPKWVKRREMELTATLEVEREARRAAEARASSLNRLLQAELAREVFSAEQHNEIQKKLQFSTDQYQKTSAEMQALEATHDQLSIAHRDLSLRLEASESKQKELSRDLASSRERLYGLQSLFEHSNNDDDIIVGRDATISTDLFARRCITVLGKVRGNILAPLVHIEASGTVWGTISSLTTVQGGHVEGTIVGWRILLKSASRTIGDVCHSQLAIEKGAYFDGKSRGRRLEEQSISPEVLNELRRILNL